ncbi:hypothetical protein ACFQHW_01500 [Lapidilactobacillus achengensis]|uniref:Uncharacterized protein n=1 Tax=Lapidilactobacillus achengensis TaxID=2486000 RepID=A0ABW1UKK0_9LACO|nr:hypothetical protein [Lapidilactobacillus achengensis]
MNELVPQLGNRRRRLLFFVGVDCRFGGFGCGRNRLGLLLRTGTWWASFEANPQAQRLGFKSSLVLSGKAAKDNFTTEPRSPSRLLGGIELICNRSWVFDEVLLQARGQTIVHFCGGTAIPTDFDQEVGTLCVDRTSVPVFLTVHGWKLTDSVDSPRTSFVYQADCTGVTNLRIITTNHGR